MSDIDHGRMDKNTSSTTYLTSLNAELMAAMQEAKSKQQKSAPNLNQPTRTELHQPIKPALGQQAAVGPNSLIRSEHPLKEPSPSVRPPTQQPQLQAQLQAQAIKPPENLPRPKGTDTEDVSRSLVGSATSMLRAGMASIPAIQRIVESRSRNDDGVTISDFKNAAKDLNTPRKDLVADGLTGSVMRSPQDVDVIQQALKQTKLGALESEKLTVVSYRFDAEPKTAEVKNQSGNLKSPEVSIQMVQQTALPAKELVISTPVVPDSAKITPARISEQTLNNNLTVSKTNVSDTVVRPAAPQIPSAIEGVYPRTTAVTAEGNSSTTIQSRDYLKNPVNAASVTGVSEAVKPGINTSINVRSFSVDGQAKTLLPNQLPAPLRSPVPYGTPVPENRSDGEPEAMDVNPNLKNMNLKTGDKRYALGAEIALVALTAAAGASRRRMESTGTNRKSQDEKQHAEDAAANGESGVSETTYTMPARKRSTMLIGKQDQLVDIAERRFDDANLGWLIAELNRNVSNQVELEGKYLVEFESRQEIVLPVWDDIVEFYADNKGPFDNSRLITIVKQTTVDQELLEATLGPLLKGYDF